MVVVSKVEWHYSASHDANDGIPWSAQHVEDLRFELEHGGSIESAARFLCRQGTVEDVRRKALELELI